MKKKLIVLFIMAVFLLTAAIAFAAGEIVQK